MDAINFVEGVLREARDVEIFFRAGERFGRGKQSGAALDRPGEQHLGGGFADSGGDGVDDRVFKQAGLHAVTERSEGQEDYAVVVAKLKEFGFGEIGMGFDLNDGRLDARGFVKGL